MESTLTIRLSAAQRRALKRRAAAENRSESAMVRDLIEQHTRGGFDFERVRSLVGSVASSPKQRKKHDSWRKQIRERNWR